MIVLKVTGGLGNQMFQVAFAKKIANETKEEIYLDTSVYKKYKIRNYALSNLKVSTQLKTLSESNISHIGLLRLRFSQKQYRLIQRIIRDLHIREKIGGKLYALLAKRGFYYNFDPYYYSSPRLSNKDICIYGYFQSEKYFLPYKKEIMEDMKVKITPTEDEKKVIDELSSCDSVGVSMRLGDDYVNSSFLNVCDEDYYYRAMDYVYKKNKNVVFYIFSDDIKRAKDNFSFRYPVKYIEGFRDYESLRLLYSCKHFVISNSSFSWWGAYLSENKEKIIVAPKKWNNKTVSDLDIYTRNMTLLDV